MSKYILEKKNEKQMIRSYIDDGNKEVINYLISILGDVEMSRDDIKVFISQFNRIAGPYDVLTEPSTIKAMYTVRTLYPKLSSEAINTLFPRYIDDLFEKEEIISKLEKFINVFGYTNEMFETYLGYIDNKGKKLQEKYIKKLSSYNTLRSSYSDKFIKYLERLTLTRHYDPQKVLEYIPMEELVKKDEENLKDLSIRYRIDFGVGYPISYKLVEAFIKNENLIDESKELEYEVRISNECIKKKAGFSINDFQNSIKSKRLYLSK